MVQRGKMQGIGKIMILSMLLLIPLEGFSATERIGLVKTWNLRRQL